MHPLDTYQPESDLTDTIVSTEPSDVEKGPRKNRRMEGRNGCCRCLCCACCLPVWATWIVWFIIISVIIVVIVLGVIAATFKMPTVEMVGITTSPSSGSQISFDMDGLSINFGLIVKVESPNVVNIQLSEMNAEAFYPDLDGDGESTVVGSGYLDEQFVPKYSNFNFTFPFAIQYNPSIDRDQSVLNDIADKCGLTGGEKKDITVDYVIHLKAKVLFITVKPTITSSATFACPLDGGALPGLADGTITQIIDG